MASPTSTRAITQPSMTSGYPVTEEANTNDLLSHEWRMVCLHSRNGVGALSRGSGLVQRVCNFVCMNYGDRNVYDIGYVTHNTGEGGNNCDGSVDGGFHTMQCNHN